MNETMVIGYKRRDGSALVGYQVYRCPEGCGQEYIGRADSWEDAIGMADKPGLDESAWATARAAGNVMGMYAPWLEDGEYEDDEPYGWAGRDGATAICPIWRTAGPRG